MLVWVGLAVLLLSVLTLLESLYAVTRVSRLADTVPANVSLGPNPPRLSLIVPACNEERSVETAVASMLAQDYPDLEIILVNDRSTDATGAIMERLARRHPSIRVVHIAQLPEGWLGKNHALWVGASHATGDWLLFADADVHFDPTTFRRAVAFGEQNGLDHVTAAPELRVKGYWLQSWVAFFTMSFLTYTRPYLANNPRSKVGTGVGAFNLVRRTAYETIGTHKAISLRPDDDLRLGRRIKRMGLKQHLFMGEGLMHVEWYTSVPEAVQGLEKNTFAGMEYSVLMVAFSVVMMATIMVWPFLAVWFVRGTAWWVYMGAIVAQWGIYVLTNFQMGGRVLALLPAYPVAALLFMYTVIRSTWLTLSQGGIRWRGTFYPLRLLKSQSGLPD